MFIVSITDRGGAITDRSEGGGQRSQIRARWCTRGVLAWSACRGPTRRRRKKGPRKKKKRRTDHVSKHRKRREDRGIEASHHLTSICGFYHISSIPNCTTIAHRTSQIAPLSATKIKINNKYPIFHSHYFLSAMYDR